MNSDPDSLYRLERPETFARVQVSAPEVLAVVERYGYLPRSAPQRVDKCNPRSSVFFVATTTAPLIVKSTSLLLAPTLEEQCAIARALADTGLIQPLRDSGGRFVTSAHGRAWTVYQASEGEIYDGSNLPLEHVLRASWNLIARARDLQAGQHIPACRHRPDRWMHSMGVLTDARQRGTALSDSGMTLAGATGAMLERGAKDVMELTTRCIEVVATLEHAVVHNDIQHANILACRGSAVFLDLEDICLEAPQVALMHGLFKVLRHRVYASASSVTEIRQQLPAILADLRRHRAWEGARAEFVDYAALRIVSDVAEILAAWTEDREAGDLYDLEKRIHNLFELLDLFEELDHGLGPHG